MDDKLQNYADIGKELMKKDGLWESALSDLEKKQKSTVPKWLIFGLILIVIVILGYVVFGGQKQADRIPIAYYEALPTSLVPNVRSSDNQPKSELQFAVMAYGEEDYADAEQLLTPLAQDNNDDLAKLYLASIYISNKNHKKASKLLNEINKDDLKDYVLWYYAINELSYNKENAKKLFQIIANTSSHFKSKTAQEILEKEFDNQ